MKQLKAESEQFRRTKANMAKEMLQLKSQVSDIQLCHSDGMYILMGSLKYP